MWLAGQLRLNYIAPFFLCDFLPAGLKILDLPLVVGYLFGVRFAGNVYEAGFYPCSEVAILFPASILVR